MKNRIEKTCELALSAMVATGAACLCYVAVCAAVAFGGWLLAL